MTDSRKPTMSDVASEAGVSLATVDRVLNGRGGVSPAKAGRILTAAKRLRLDRALVRPPGPILRVAVLIQSPANAFHADLRTGIQLASRLYSDLNLQFLVHHIDPKDPARTAAIIAEQARRCDAIILSGPDDPRVAAAVRERATHIPVVTMADDIPDSGRAAFVGPDDRQAGRIAGDLFGRFIGRDGGHVVMIIGSPDIRGHRERETGIRAALAEFHERTTVSQVIESGEDPDRAGLIVTRALASDPTVRGIYVGTTGAREAAAAVARAGARERVTIIVHELTDTRRALLRQRAIDAVIDQNPALEARVAVETVARLLGRMEGAPASTRTGLRIYMPENA
jgi:LacI family transcriptional regulator